MNTKWVTLQKDAPERKPKPAASSSLLAAMCCHIQGVETGKRECLLSAPQPSTSNVKSKVLDSPSAPTLHFPSQGCSCRRKTKLNFAMLQHTWAKALHQKYVMSQVTANLDHRQSSHSEVKLECLQQIRQKHASFTWNHQTDVFLFTDAGEGKTFLFTRSSACLYKALNHDN